MWISSCALCSDGHPVWASLRALNCPQTHSAFFAFIWLSKFALCLVGSVFTCLGPAHASWSKAVCTLFKLFSPCPLALWAGVHFNFGTPRIPLCHRAAVHVLRAPRACTLCVPGFVCSCFSHQSAPSCRGGLCILPSASRSTPLCTAQVCMPRLCLHPGPSTFWAVRVVCTSVGLVCPPSLGWPGFALCATSVMCTGEVYKALNSLNVEKWSGPQILSC